jgi:predicted ATPase
LLREAFARHHGAEVDTQGDAFFIAFPSVLGGVMGAVDGQRALAEHDWGDGNELKVRMGLHTGFPRRTDEGYVGIELHEAARIASAAHGGQVLVSAETEQLVREQLNPDVVTLRDIGTFRLKDVESQQVYQLVPEGLPADFPPPRSIEQRPNNLPVPLTPFIGRGKLAADLRDLILRTDVRCATLLGPGGTGKTRLSIRVATELLYRFEDGVFFVGLAPVADATLVPAAIASALGVREEAEASLLDSIISFLEDKELLLVLDNFEHVQQAASDIAALLGHCGGLKVLATSRQPLRLSGERGVPIPPLTLPDPDAALDVAEANRFEAVNLFVDRAMAARWDFELTESNVADVVEICRRVDALPLAIELAAGRLYAMDTEALLTALSSRLNVLTEGAVDLLDHQRTLRDLVAWSYELLEPHERQLWRRLAVFNGGCTEDAAEDICNPEEDLEIQAEMDLLVSKSLLTREGVSESGVGKVLRSTSGGARLSMLQTLREFAREQLEASGEAATLVSAHRQWFLALAEKSQPHLRGEASSDWLKRLEQETANFRAALDSCEEGPTADAEMALQLGSALYFLWFRRGLMTEARERLERALERTAGQRTQLRGAALMAAASLARYQNRADSAEPLVEEALSISRHLDDSPGIANALRELGALAQRREEYGTAREYFEQAIALYRDIEEPERLAWTLNNMGIAAQLMGDLEQAESSYQQSLDVARQIDDPISIGSALANLGEIAQLRGDIEASKHIFRDSLIVWQRLDHRLPMAHCLELLAGIDIEQGRAAEAVELLGAASVVREEIDVPVEPFNMTRYQADRAAALEALGEEAFDSCWQRGRSMDLEGAVDLAMIDLEPA